MKTAKIFKNGQSQAVRLPREFRFEGNEVFVKKMGRSVVLMSTEHGWAPLLDSLKMFSSDFIIDRGQPRNDQKRENMFD